jgi:hypothetical protein
MRKSVGLADQRCASVPVDPPYFSNDFSPPHIEQRHLRATSMRRHLVLLAAAFALAPRGAAAEESSWIFRASCYSHSPQTGQRVAQYQPEEPAPAPADDTYQQSGYRYIHSGICVGNSQDHVHVVQTWGQGDSIRPYGEWEYPYRPGATPYGPWGNPQGPWTSPFNSPQNPYGAGQFGQAPWQSAPTPVGPWSRGPGPSSSGPWGQGSGAPAWGPGDAAAAQPPVPSVPPPPAP